MAQGSGQRVVPLMMATSLVVCSSLVLIAIGAILKFAETASVSGLNLSTVGVVLMVVWIAGVVISLIVTSTKRRTGVVHQTARVDYVEPKRVDDVRI